MCKVNSANVFQYKHEDWNKYGIVITQLGTKDYGNEVEEHTE